MLPICDFVRTPKEVVGSHFASTWAPRKNMVEEAIIDVVPFRSVGDLGGGRGEVAIGPLAQSLSQTAVPKAVRARQPGLSGPKQGQGGLSATTPRGRATHLQEQGLVGDPRHVRVHVDRDEPVLQGLHQMERRAPEAPRHQRRDGVVHHRAPPGPLPDLDPERLSALEVPLHRLEDLRPELVRPPAGPDVRHEERAVREGLVDAAELLAGVVQGDGDVPVPAGGEH